MSIAGIAKEVTTIICAAWLFGDELTPLNITGVAITACGKETCSSPCSALTLRPNATGIGLFTWHKYERSINTDIALDPHGNPLPVEEVAGGDIALEAGEMQRLTEDVDEPLDDEDGEEADQRHVSNVMKTGPLGVLTVNRQHADGRLAEGQLLFSVEDEDDEEGSAGMPLRAVRTDSLPPPYSDDGAEPLHRIWDDGRGHT
ncbi:hypothetical protein TRAPUB_14189 [Trametes pubescens]|uniref:Uncharacterized protein n=1 Tax=Trametes pubescens TaxID=154538 RepID=A0A1M2W7R7_TRAPU|nr:hypothetical protein TRAPUB_14189 [Trametes pubescens]